MTPYEAAAADRQHTSAVWTVIENIRGIRREVATASYCPPIEKICPSCGRKHTGYLDLCESCGSRP